MDIDLELEALNNDAQWFKYIVIVVSQDVKANYKIMPRQHIIIDSAIKRMMHYLIKELN